MRDFLYFTSGIVWIGIYSNAHTLSSQAFCWLAVLSLAAYSIFKAR